MARKKQRKTGKPLTLESKDTTRPSSSTQFEEENRGDGEEQLEIENSSTSIVDLVAVEKTVNEVSAAKTVMNPASRRKERGMGMDLRVPGLICFHFSRFDLQIVH